MPSAAEVSRGRAQQLLGTLDQTKSHFVEVESSSGSGSSGEEGSGETRAPDSEGKFLRKPRRKLPVPSPVSSVKSADDALQAGNMSVRYSRVTSDERASPITEAERSKRRRSQLAERISNKLHALFWAVVGLMVAYYTDFVRVLMEDERVNRAWFNVGIVCFSINVVILAYLTVWLPHIRNIKVSWNVYSPRAIPTATGVGLVCALTLNVALWNVWGFLTPLILFAVFVGCLFSLHFVPWPC